MIQILRYRPSPAMAVALVALLVALGGVAFATIPDPSGEIHACFKKANGDLRLVDSAAGCRNNEKAVEWSQRGPKGDPGAPGGSAVVARVRGTTSQVATNSPAAYPLNDNTWTQQAGETDLILAQINATPPADCGAGIAFVQAEMSVDGQFVAGASQIGSGAQNMGTAFIFEPGVSTNRTAAVRISDNCTNQHFTVNSVKVNVFGFR